MFMHIFCRLIQHPNLSSLLGVVSLERGKAAIITQLVRGVSLNEHLFGEARKVCSTSKFVSTICSPLHNAAFCD